MKKRLLSLLLVLAMVLLSVPTEVLPTVQAEEGTTTYYTEGDWTYYVKDGGAIIGARYGKAYSGSKTGVITPTTLGGYPVIGIGEDAFYYNNTMTSLTISEGVTFIGRTAIYSCSNLTKITIPSTVTTIAYNAVLYCRSLTAIHTPSLAAWCSIQFEEDYANPLYQNGSEKDVRLYVNGKMITDLVIPEEVTSVGDYAFYGAEQFTSVTFPKGFVSVGTGAFTKCSNLSAVYAPSLKDWCAITFNNQPLMNARKLYIADQLITDLVIPEGITHIGKNVFSNCLSINRITFPSSLVSIDEYAFYCCLSIQSVTFNNSGPLSVKQEAFSGCDVEQVYTPSLSAWLNMSFENDGSSPLCRGADSYGHGGKLYVGGQLLTDLVIPSDVSAVKPYAFHGCACITSVTFPDGFRSVGDSAFYKCTKIAKVSAPSIEAWLGISFGNDFASNPVNYSKNLYLDGELLTEAVIPEGTARINDFAFFNCLSVTSVSLPDSVTEIGKSAFAYIPITALTFPSRLVSIGNFAFSRTGLEAIVLPDAVTAIGERAFQQCASAKTVTIPASVTSIGKDAFGTCAAMETVNITDMEAWQAIAFGNEAANPLSNGAELLLNGEKITHVSIPEGTVVIKPYVFAGYEHLTSLTMPQGLTEIGDYAFSGTEIGPLYIPDSVTAIGANTFKNCPFITIYGEPGSYAETYARKYYIPFMDANGCEVHTYENSCNQCTVCGYVDDAVFAYTVTGNKATITSGTTGTPAYTGSYTNVVVPAYIGGYPVAAIGDSAFYIKTGIKTVTLPAGITVIAQKAFYKCYNLTNITLPSKVTRVSDYAFYNCIRLEAVELPDSLTSIGKSAFAGDTVLGNTYISKNVTTVDTNAFADCPALIIYGQTGTTIHTYAVENGIPFVSNGCATHSYTEATCQAPKTCIYCGITLGSKTGHKYAAATCTKPMTCVHCGFTYGFALGHNWVDATCIAPKTCTRCGSTEGEPSGIHAWKAATCIAPKTCIHCGTTEGTITDHRWQDASCTTPKTCSVCKAAEGDPLGHVYHDPTMEEQDTANVCWRCSYLDASVFSYTVSNGAATVTGCQSPCAEYYDVFIPNTLGGCPVTAIGDDAFAGQERIRSVHLPDSVTTIGDRAFKGCDWVTAVILPKGLTKIGEEAFAYCSVLSQSTMEWNEAFVIPDSVTEIGAGAFYYCQLLDKVELPASLTVLPREVFAYCGDIDISLPATLTAIGDYAFAYCDKMPALVLPNGVVSIGNYAFLGAELPAVAIPKTTVSIAANAFSRTEGFTIYGFTDSYAEAYAAEKNFPFVALTQGDTDGDNTLTPSDAVYLLYHTMLPDDYPAGVQGMDVNGDGTVDSEDAVCLLYHILLPDLYPLEL